MRPPAIVAVVALFACPAAAQNVRVIDGDTIEIGAVTYRLHGIDAPEAGQRCTGAGGKNWPCGEAATRLMEDLVSGGALVCDDTGRDVYGRVLSVCRAGETVLNRTMVASGLAWSFRRYAHDYDDVEDAARAAGEGVWRAPTETPWDFRARLWIEAGAQAPSNCPIKGNINREGVRIYHAPWSPWYGRTRVNEDDGERWFCDESEAIAAGWRAPRWGR